MSSPYDRRSSRSQRGVWSHWVPLAVTLTIATVGAAAWVWSQREDDQDDNEHEPGLDYDNADYGDNPPYGSSRDVRGPQQPPRSRDDTYGAATGVMPGGMPGEMPGALPGDMPPGANPAHNDPSAAGWGSRMSGALRRTPSPQQFLDSTGKTVAAGVAAAGAAVGKALASIREEDKGLTESNPWSEEADAKRERAPGTYDKRRRTVVVVVSADTQIADMDEDGMHEHASILSHIPRHNDFSKVKLFVLIYAPGMKDTATENATSNMPPASLSSSFSNIGHDQAQTPGEEAKSPIMSSSAANSAFNAVYSQALTLVDKESMILPFTSANGHVHIMRHLQPEIIYLQESLAGENGSIITNLQTWLRHDVILVVGAESGSGGLADSESEAEKTIKPEQWWQRPERVGRGRGVIVVDGMRVHDDWSRRVQGVE